MPIKALTALFALAVAVCAAPLHADEAAPALPMQAVAAPLAGALPLFNPAPALAQSALPASAEALLASAVQAPEATVDADAGSDLRKTLIDLAMTLRHIRYVRGGHDPATGFDCSGFVRYVFGEAIGLHLPRNAASQFLAGLKVKRGDMQPGDLVFFRTAGRRGRISHVGIYIDNGKFIHSPSRGETVRVDNLSDRYWSRRFAGAKRPEAMAQVDTPADKG
ncbi:C40 family peptidase [Dyella sp.]|jgi:cell wall-associated NlpC family hydrolase|uniref:C40 family peptidase n=1 Tax=Dyella sp. TaxID=1869338 RepID=UPI002D76552A|nr:C40 family peptidase [Dyella sp.]HET6433726.1 C40 family peptidase [Dyella sp.]